ncbi:hypothetical protein B0I35DRAFT_470116 [Stachybotrys elegans]|uniref:Uncharacterized protein n=1 Tax=Stachybotrys elegans TaxID=80388 RepID=A0A8K0SP50_9HYPO|nr:hypothetical protein B0I35DRAFT_470116 [Stachybotrys elegans]
MSTGNLVWFITGANSGLGLAMATYALSQGHTVILTACNLDKFPNYLKDEPNADLIKVEIAGPAASIMAAVNDAVSRHGRVDMSSLRGLDAGQGAPLYAASKFAVEGLAEGLYNELKDFRIQVHLIEPGAFRTNFLADTSQGKSMRRAVEGYIDINSLLAPYHGKQTGDPQRGAERIFEVVTGTGMGHGLE